MRPISPFQRRKATEHDARVNTKTAKNEKVDSWLLRSVQIATVLGVVLAIFGYFYSVRPIYQKALLDEVIAKKETELRLISKSLEESYGQIRNYMLRNFIFNLGPECSGLLKPLPKVTKLGEPPSKPLSVEEDFDSLDVSKCLTEGLSRNGGELSSLRRADLETLTREVARTAKDLAKKQVNIATKIKALPSLARNNPGLLKPADDLIRRLQLLKVPDEQISAMAVQVALERSQRSLMNDFYDEVRSDLLQLHKINWQQ